MGVERKEDIQVIKSKDTRAVSVRTVITTTDTKPPTINFTDEDAIGERDNRITIERLKSYGFLGGMAAGTIGGVSLIIAGIESFNPEQVGIGAGALVLSRYFFKSARKAIYEASLAGREKNKIKHTR